MCSITYQLHKLLMGECLFPIPNTEINVINYCHHFYSTPYNTNQLVSNNIYMDNRLFECVYPMVNFVLDLYTNVYRQKDSKLVCFVFQL